MVSDGSRFSGLGDGGELAVGYRADIVVFDMDFHVRSAFYEGQQVV